jgi:hypothetical protein
MKLENAAHGLLAVTYFAAACSALVVVGWGAGCGDAESAGPRGRDSSPVTSRDAGLVRHSHRPVRACPLHRPSFISADRAANHAVRKAAWS